LKKSTALVRNNDRHFIDDYLPYLLAQTSQAVSREFRTCLAEADVSVIEWRVLSTLFDHPQISVGRLSEIVMCKQPTLSKAIDRMEAKGWVARSLSRHDRRMISVSIDKPGNKIVKALIAESNELEQRELEGFSRKDMQTLKRILRDLVRHCADTETSQSRDRVAPRYRSAAKEGSRV